MQFYKYVFLSVSLLVSCNQACCNDTNTEKKQVSRTEKNEVNSLENPGVRKEEEASPYNKLMPVIGWERYSGDSARSIKGWFRWWKYLRMKEPIVMNWIDGLHLRIYPGNEIFRALFVRGIYDPNLVVTINSLLHKGGVLIDVGSNMGYFSLLASKVVGEEGRILALEPSSRDFARLVDNIKINGLNNLISPYRLAVSDKVGKTKLSIACEERSALNTMGAEFSLKGIEKVDIEEVETTSIDEFVQNKHLDRVDVLKLDIEGGELNALLGAKNTIEKYRPAIMLGINCDALKSCGSNITALQKILGNFRYRVYKLVEYPVFALEQISTDLAKAHTKVVFCFHESFVPPSLPQPEKKTIMDRINDFFLR